MTWTFADFKGLSPEARDRVVGFTTTRDLGVSQGNYKGLNLASHVDDNINDVQTNRAILREQLTKQFNQQTQPYWLNQTHSNNVCLLPEQYKASSEFDASITQQRGLICAVLTADCLPILVVNKQASEVAAIHAGWRGVYNGVIANTIDKMHSSAEQLCVWIGPAISQQVFEVGAEVKQQFVDQDSDYQSCFTAINNVGRFMADLPAIAAMQMGKLGVKHITLNNQCSYLSEQYYSYRRDGQTGRMASLIWLS